MRVEDVLDVHATGSRHGLARCRSEALTRRPPPPWRIGCDRTTTHTLYRRNDVVVVPARPRALCYRHTFSEIGLPNPSASRSDGNAAR